MPQTQTKADMQPPSNGPPVATAFWSDEIEKLGDQIAALSADQARQLSAYLKKQGIKDGIDRS
jgi:hypothetical protein